MTEPISVTALNQYIKGLLDRDRLLSQVLVRSEISNYKVYPSGHHYFSLKDAESSIRCVMFRREAGTLRFRPENGMKVVVTGRVSLFPRDGVYQLYCSRMVPDGVGELAFAFEQLKNRLYREGLFDSAHKQPIPSFPHTIALVTSPAGAAVRDMIRILGTRWPLAEVLVVPVRVQGEEAPQEICQALELINLCHMADLIITGRGGGTMEDLWAFNEEAVAPGHLPVRNSGDFRRGTRTGCDHRGLCGRPAGRDPLQRRRTGGSRSKRPAGNFGPFGGAAPEHHGPGNPTTAGPAPPGPGQSIFTLPSAFYSGKTVAVGLSSAAFGPWDGTAGTAGQTEHRASGGLSGTH